MKSNTTTILVAVGALLVGGVATAAFLKGGDKSPTAQDGLVTAADGALVADDAAATDNQLPVGTLQYAEVVKAEPITSSEKLYATVIGTEPVRETTTTSTPREVCEDVVVQERLPERDGNAGGTVAGAVIGGLLGNQVGGGSGKKAATVAGAVAGGVIGNQVDKRHVGGMHFSAAEENLLVAAFKRFRVILCAAAGGQVLHLPEAHQLRCLPGRGRHAIRHPGCRDGSIHCGVQERSPPVEPGLFCDVRHTRAMGRVSQPGLPFRAAYLPPMGRRGPGFRGAQTKSGDRSRLIPRCCCQRTVGHAGGRQGLW